MTFFCSALVAPCADGVPGNPGKHLCRNAEPQERRDPGSTFRPTDQPTAPAKAESLCVIVRSSTVLAGSGGVPPWARGPGPCRGHLAALGGGCDPCQSPSQAGW